MFALLPPPQRRHHHHLLKEIHLQAQCSITRGTLQAQTSNCYLNSYTNMLFCYNPLYLHKKYPLLTHIPYFLRIFTNHLTISCSISISHSSSCLLRNTVQMATERWQQAAVMPEVYLADNFGEWLAGSIAMVNVSNYPTFRRTN